MKKSCRWHKATLYSLVGLAIVAFSYASTFVRHQSMLHADVLGEVPVTVEQVYPVADSVLPTSFNIFLVDFTGQVDESTMTSDTVKMSYLSGEETLYVSGELTYDPDADGAGALTFVPDGDLPAETTLTLEITEGLLDMGATPAPVGPFSVQYTTTAEVDEVAPEISNSFPGPDSTNIDPWLPSIHIGFNEDLNPDIDENSWASTGENELVSTGTYYDPSSREIVIALDYDILDPELTYQITLNGASVVDGSGNALAEDYVLTFTTAASNSTYDDGYWDDPNNQMWNPVNTWPDASLAGLETTYHFSFPITVALNDGYKIAITFPEGYDIGEASDEGFWENKDINMGNDSVVAIESLDVNEVTRTVTLTLDSDGEFGDDTENLYFSLGGIVNPDTPGYEYTLSFTTKDADGATLEGPNNFNYVSIQEPGDGVATVYVKETGTEDPIPGATVYISNWMVGTQKIVTNESGAASVSGIPVYEWGTDVYTWIDGNNIPDGYKPTWANQNIRLTTGEPSGSVTIYMDPANLRITGTITHAGVGADGETKVHLWASGPSWTNKELTLDADGATDYTLYLADPGFYNVGLDKYYDPMSGQYDNSAAFIPPSPSNQQLTSNNTAEDPLVINFNLEVADKVIEIHVVDQDGNPISNPWCSVSSDFAMAKPGMGGDMGSDVAPFWSGGQGDSNGVCNIYVKEGKFIANANVQGVSGQMRVPVTVEEDDSTVEVELVIKMPDIVLSGSVTDENSNGIEYANVNCHTTNGWGEWVYDNTDSNGEFVMYVNEGTWTCDVWAPNIGFVPAADGVDATDFEVDSDVTDLNFAHDPDAFANITGVLQDSEGDPKTYTWIWADKVNTDTNWFAGYGNGASTDGTGAFSIRVPKNDNDETYRVQMWDQSFGQFVLEEDADASDGDVDLGTVSLPETHEVTISATSVPGEQYFVYANINNTENQTWSWASIPLTNGSGSTTIQLPDGNYDAHMWIPGFGENKENFSIDGASASVDFDFSAYTFTTYNVTVSDSEGPVANAYVEAFDHENGAYMSNFTDSNGLASLTVFVADDSVYTIKANEPNHVSSMVDAQVGVTDYALTLVEADSSISGTVSDDEGDPLSYTWVDAVSVDETSWVGTMSDGAGNFELQVPSDTTWNVMGHSPFGTHGIVENVVAGEENVNLVLDQTKDYFIPSDPVSVSVDPTETNSVSSDNADLSIPAGALGADTNGVTVNIEKTAAVAETESTNPLGNYGIDITANDSGGNDITSLDDTVNLEVKIDKEQIEALLENEVITVDEFDAPLGYFNEVSGAWTILDGASVSVEVQEEEGSDYETVSIEDFITDYETTYSNYSDYSVNYTANTDHFTIFAPVVGEGDDDAGDDDVVGDDDDGGGGGGSGGIVDDESADDTDEIVNDNAGDDTATSLDYKNHWAKDYIKELFERGFVSGCGDGNFCPDNNITRGELLKIAMNVYEIIPEPNLANTFKDVAAHWAKDYVLTAYKYGIVSGYGDGTFRPDTQITRAEALKILYKASSISVKTGYPVYDNPFVDISPTDWFYDYVMTAYYSGIIKGYNIDNVTYFKPNQNITRAEISKISLMIEDIIHPPVVE